MNNEQMYELYESNIKEIKAIDNLSRAYGLLDDQHYLLWKDSLNSLSLDPDRD